MHGYPSWLIPYQPRLGLSALVKEINEIYHTFDAHRYESDHIEIRELWPELWFQMLQRLPFRKYWRVLDFGCGNGFASEQVLRFLGDRVTVLMAYDPCSEMLLRARKKFTSDSRVILTPIESEIWRRSPYDLLVTNSVLHHLPEGACAIHTLQQYLSHDAWWLAGNEPSSRFYANPECLQLFQEYELYQQKTKWLRPSRYLSRIHGILRTDTLSKTAEVAIRRRLLAVRPDRATVARLVDFHVQHSADDPRGFDPISLQDALSPRWKTAWSKTYSYLGSVSELRAGNKWRSRAAELARKFPADGASFCSVWHQTAN